MSARQPYVFAALTVVSLSLTPVVSGASSQGTSVGAVTAAPSAQTRIIGGKESVEPYSFAVSLGHCGAALIDKKWIVTAAHCISGLGTNISVRIGSLKSDDGGELIKIARWVRHPKSTDRSHDIAVGHLVDEAKSAPVAVASTPPAVGTPTRILGWGSTTPRPPVQSSRVLRELDTSITDPGRCNGTDGPSIDAANELCTDNPDKQGPCIFDSGSPQITKVDGRWHLVGATNRGKPAADCGQFASAYASVAAHLPWLRAATGVPTLGGPATPAAR